MGLISVFEWPRGKLNVPWSLRAIRDNRHGIWGTLAPRRTPAPRQRARVPASVGAQRRCL